MALTVRPLKQLGQHFLKDRNIARSIVESVDIQEGDAVLEIGPGEGVLTERLLESCASQIICVEIDSRLADILHQRFGSDSRFRLVHDDFLSNDGFSHFDDNTKIRVVGNLPYSITSPILFHLLEKRDRIEIFVAMMQREVAQRIVSGPGSKIYGIPSVLFQMVSHPEILFPVSRKSFRPIPKVESAVMRFRFLPEPAHPVQDEQLFIQIVKTTFGQRRKMLKNTLQSFITKIELEQTPMDLTQRPEQLSCKQFADLSNWIVDRME